MAAAMLAAAAALAAQPAASALPLPDSFAGVLPCNDCDGVRTQLDLWPDGVFHLRREFIGKPGRDDELGRWRLDPSRPVILLYAGREMPLRFEQVAPRLLRALDLHGRPVAPGAAGELRAESSLRPADLKLPLHGMVDDRADGPRFEECLSGRVYPLAASAGLQALQAAVGAAQPQTRTALMASFDGSIAWQPAPQGAGPAASVVVQRFIGIWPGQRCERALSHASLTDQYWRIVSLRGRPVVAAEGQREAHLILRGQDRHFRATIACDRRAGHYQVEGPRLSFTLDAPAAHTPCAGTRHTPAAAFDEALGAVRRWRIHAQVLEWFDEHGASIALFEAVYLR